MEEEILYPRVAFFKMRSPEAFTNRHIEEASKTLKVDDDGEFLFRIRTHKPESLHFCSKPILQL